MQLDILPADNRGPDFTDIPCCMEQTSKQEPGRAVRRQQRGPRETWPPSSAAANQKGSHTIWRGAAVDNLDELQTSKKMTKHLTS